METIVVITDSAGNKALSIGNCFESHFERPNYYVETHVLDVEKPDTPYSFNGLRDCCLNRIDNLKKTKTEFDRKKIFISTIQKGFYPIGRFWYFGMFVGIDKYNDKQIIASGCAVQLSEQISKKLSSDIGLKDTAIKKAFPDFDKNKQSLFNLLTGEDEVIWFSETLRRNLKGFKV